MQAAIHNLWGQGTCDIRICAACTFGFAYPYVGGDAEFYSIRHEDAGYPGWKWDFDVGLREGIERFDRGRVIDIGAGDGAFLRRIDGTKWERCAIEATPAMRSTLVSAGIEVFDSEQEAVSKAAGTFQVVTLFQVLEHLSIFRETLATARKLCAPDGRLIVVVPYGDGISTQERLSGVADMPPNHVNRWTPESLAKAFQQSGFDPEPALLEPVDYRRRLINLSLMTVLNTAAKPGTLAARMARFRNRKLRTIALAPLVALTSLRLLLRGREIWFHHSFALCGRAR